MACATLKRSLDFDPLHSPSHVSPKRRRCLPMNISPSTPPTRKSETKSAFEMSPKLSSEEIAAKISLEIKKMQRRRQVLFPGQQYPSPSSSPPPSSSQFSHLQDGNQVQSPSTFTFGALSPSKRDTPLFTFRQVNLICERMMKEREEQIREQYDKVLTCKLAEQYEAFLKFNHDQIQRRFVGQSTATYVS